MARPLSLRRISAHMATSDRSSKTVIAFNVKDEKISHGLQLRLTVAQGEWTDPREIEGPSTLRHPHAPSHSGRTTVLCDCANQLLG